MYQGCVSETPTALIHRNRYNNAPTDSRKERRMPRRRHDSATLKLVSRRTNPSSLPFGASPTTPKDFWPPVARKARQLYELQPSAAAIVEEVIDDTLQRLGGRR